MQKSLKCDCENQKRWNQRRQTILDSFSSRITVRFCGQNQQNSATHQSKSSKASKKKTSKLHDKSRTSWNHVHRAHRRKKGPNCLYSLFFHSTALPLGITFATIVVALHRYFLLFAFFSLSLSLRFVFSAIQLQASRTSTWSTLLLQKQHFLCDFFPLLTISYRFACPPSLQFSYSVVNLRVSQLQMHSLVRALESTIVLRWKICRSLLFCILFDRKALKT